MTPSDYIPFRDSIHISQYDSSRRVLHNGEGKYFLINDKTQRLVVILKNSQSWKEAYIQFTDEESEDLTLDGFIQFVCSVLHISTKEESHTRKSYLRLRLTIFKKDIAGLLGDIFKFLYHKEIIFLCILSLFNCQCIFCLFSD